MLGQGKVIVVVIAKDLIKLYEKEIDIHSRLPRGQNRNTMSVRNNPLLNAAYKNHSTVIVCVLSRWIRS